MRRTLGEVAPPAVEVGTGEREHEHEDDPRVGTGPESTFDPPAVPPLAVARRRVGALLDLALHQRLTIVVAPPGYGKTVLLAQWAATHPRQRVRWLTLTPQHDDVTTFAGQLREALDPCAVPDDGLEVRPRPDDVEGRSTFVSGILAAIERLPPTHLVLDDFHVLSNAALLDDLAALIEHAPRSLRVVIATRCDPPLHYYRICLSDVLVELRQEDLAFTSDEASELIRLLTGRVLRRSQVDTLVARTEGWAAGLQLAALSLRERTEVDDFVETFADDDRHVADYLTEQVLRQQPEEVRAFLLSTAVLDRMSGALCDAVTGGHGARAMLEELDRRSMFITKLDARQEWFRYHQLFRALLRQRLHDADPALERRLLRAAATWHLERDDPETAVRYLAEAGAWDEVLGVVTLVGRRMLAAGRAGTVAAWIELVPPSAREGDVGTVLLLAAASLLSGDVRRGGEILDTVDAMGGRTGGEHVVTSLLRAYWMLQRGAVTEAVRAAETTLRELEHVEDGTVPDILGLTKGRQDVGWAARVIRGIGFVYLGRFADARPSLGELAEDAHAMWQVSALGSLALLEAWSGELRAATQLGLRALSLARQFGTEQESITTDASLALVEVARQRGELDRARATLEEAKRRSSPDRRRLVATMLATEQGLLDLTEGMPSSGLATITARGVGERRTVPGAIAARRRAVEAELMLLAGDLEGAASTLALAPEETVDIVAARVRLAVERGDLGAARALVERYPDEPQPRAGLERELWYSILAHLEGDDRAAREHLLAVVAATEPEHNVSLFRSRHVLGPARALYREAPTPYLRTIVDQDAGPSRAHPVKELVEQLTEREFMVLRLLPTRLSNAEIADTLGVSLNTVKTHLKHIYRKLDVTERTGAIAAADRLHLF